MKEGNLRRLLKAMVLALTLATLFSVTAAAATTTVKMKKSSSELYDALYSFEGIQADGGTVYHKITLKKSGSLEVFGVGYNSTSTHSFRVTLCNSKKKSLERTAKGPWVNFDLANEKVKSSIYGLKKGTYYIKVTGEKQYTLFAGFKAVADKGGASQQKATTIKRGKAITGVMPAGENASKADWFKFKVTQNKVLILGLAASGNGKFVFYLYGPGYKKSGYKIDSIMNDYGAYNSMNRWGNAIKVKKGTYYVKVVRASGKNKKSSGVYALTWDLE